MMKICSVKLQTLWRSWDENCKICYQQDISTHGISMIEFELDGQRREYSCHVYM